VKNIFNSNRTEKKDFCGKMRFEKITGYLTGEGLHRYKALVSRDFKSRVSADSTTPAEFSGRKVRSLYLLYQKMIVFVNRKSEKKNIKYLLNVNSQSKFRSGICDGIYSGNSPIFVELYNNIREKPFLTQ